MKITSLLAITILLAISAAAHAVPFFSGVGFAPGEPLTRAYGISPDGTTVVGAAGSPAGVFAVYWTEAEGLTMTPVAGPATAVALYGAVIVGESFDEAFRWTPAFGEDSLGVLPGTFDSAATDTSADGSVVVGNSGDRAFRWFDTPTGGEMVELVGLGGEALTRAYAVSADGRTTVGMSGTPGFGSFAVHWIDDGPPLPLGHAGSEMGSAHDVSADGSVIVGRLDDQPFRWSDDHIVTLGLLAGDTEGGATAVSADGSVVLGYSGSTPFVWYAGTGMRDLWSVLTVDYGLDLSGWTLQEALGLSADGLVVTGWGINPHGQTEGWVASMRTSLVSVPEPSALLLLGGTLLLVFVGRRRHAESES